MSPDCRTFRARLADALRSPLTGGPALGGLGWHAHVIHCAVCRELLAEEEALDELLRSLPEPHLPRALAERVLSRLDAARRGLDLDRLLDLPCPEPAPSDLARSVLLRVHAEQALDRLLARAPAPEIPAGLERRVLAKLALARRSVRSSVEPQRSAVRALAPSAQAPDRKRLALRVAAGFALVSAAAFGAWSVRRFFLESPQAPTPDLVIDAPVTPKRVEVQAPATVALPTSLAQPDEELLASLEMFETWDLLSTSAGVDASLSTLDSLDEYLLDFESATATTDTPAPAPADSETPSRKG